MSGRECETRRVKHAPDIILIADVSWRRYLRVGIGTIFIREYTILIRKYTISILFLTLYLHRVTVPDRTLRHYFYSWALEIISYYMYLCLCGRVFFRFPIAGPLDEIQTGTSCLLSHFFCK